MTDHWPLSESFTDGSDLYGLWTEVYTEKRTMTKLLRSCVSREFSKRKDLDFHFDGWDGRRTFSRSSGEKHRSGFRGITVHILVPFSLYSRITFHFDQSYRLESYLQISLSSSLIIFSRFFFFLIILCSLDSVLYSLTFGYSGPILRFISWLWNSHKDNFYNRTRPCIQDKLVWARDKILIWLLYLPLASTYTTVYK